MAKLTAEEVRENYLANFVRVVVGSIINDRQIYLEEDVSLFIFHEFKSNYFWTVTQDQIKFALRFWKNNDLMPTLKKEISGFARIMAEHEGLPLTENFRTALHKYETRKHFKPGIHIKLIEEDATII